MMVVLKIIIVLLAPIIGALIYGLERVVKAKMQNRKGPPLLQPFYDLFKLMDKKNYIVSSSHALLALFHLIAVWISFALFVFGVDLILIIFMHLLSNILLIVAAFSVNSIYSHMGANRELIAALCYEPILILCAVGFFMLTGSFEVGVIFESDKTLLFYLPLLFITFMFAMLVKLKKSPFDFTEAHQEIIGGAEIEYGGIFFEALYTAKVIDYLFIFSFLYLFASNSILIGAILVIFAFFAMLLIDNSTARLSYIQSVKIAFFIMIPLASINLLILKLVV